MVANFQIIFLVGLVFAVLVNAQAYQQGVNLGIGFVDEITGYNTRDGSVFVSDLTSTSLNVGTITTSGTVASAVATSGSHTAVTPLNSAITSALGVISLSGSGATLRSDQANVMIGSSSSATTIAAGTSFSAKSGQLDVNTQTMALSSSTLAVTGSQTSVFADRDISFSVQTAVNISTPTALDIQGSVGSFLASGSISVLSSQSSVTATAMGDFSINSGFDTTLVANNGAVLETIHDDVSILAPNGITQFNGTNVALRGTDGVVISAATKLNINANNNLVLFSDQASIGGGSISIQTSNFGGTISLSSSGAIVGVSKSLTFSSPVISIGSGQAINFFGKGSVKFAASNPFQLTGSTVSVTSSAASLYNGNSGVSITSTEQSNFSLLPSSTGTIAFQPASNTDTLSFTATNSITTTTKATETLQAGTTITYGTSTSATNILGDGTITLKDTTGFTSTATNVLTGSQAVLLTGTGLLQFQAPAGVTDKIISGGDVTIAATAGAATYNSALITATIVGPATFTATNTISFNFGTYTSTSALDTNFAAGSSLSVTDQNKITFTANKNLAFRASTTSTLATGAVTMNSVGLLVDSGTSSNTISSSGANTLTINQDWTISSQTTAIKSTANDIIFNPTSTMVVTSASNQGSMTAGGFISMATNTDFIGNGPWKVISGGALSLVANNGLQLVANYKNANLNNVLLLSSTSGTGAVSLSASTTITVDGGGIAVSATTGVLSLNSAAKFSWTATDDITFTAKQSFTLVPVNALTITSGDVMDISSGGDMSIQSQTDSTFTGSQLVQISTPATIDIQANLETSFSAPSGSLDIQAVTSGSWSAPTVSITGASQVALSSGGKMSVTSAGSNPNSMLFSSPLISLYGQDTLGVTSSATTFTSTSTGITSFLTDTISFSSTGGVVSQDSKNYFVSGSKTIVGTFSTSLTMTSGSTFQVTGGSYSLLSTGNTVVTAAQTLTVQGSPLALGNQNDHFVTLTYASPLSTTANTNLNFLSTGSDKSNDRGTFISSGNNLLVTSTAATIPITGFSGINLASGGATTIQAINAFGTTLQDGGYIFDARGGAGIVLTSQANGAAAVGGIKIDSQNAELRVISNQAMALTASTSASFTAGDGVFVSSSSDITSDSKLAGGGTTTFQGATIAHIVAGSDSVIANGVFKAQASSLTATAGTSLRIHSLSRISNANKVGIALTANGGAMAVQSQTDSIWHADGAFSVVASAATGNILFKATGGDLKFVSQNENIAVSTVKGSTTFTSVNSAILSAGGQTGSVLLQSNQDLTVKATLGAINYFAVERALFNAAGAVSVQSTSDLTLLTNNPTSTIAIRGTAGVSLVSGGATSPGVKVDARAILSQSNTLQVTSPLVNIGTAHTLFNPRVELRGASVQVTSAGGAVLSSDSDSFIINSFSTGSYLATNLIRMGTQGNAYIAAPKPSGLVSFSTQAASSRLSLAGAISTELNGFLTTLTSTAGNVNLVAVSNVAGNDFNIYSKSSASFNAPAGPNKWTFADVVQANTVTTAVQAGSMLFDSRRNLLVDSDNTIAFSAAAGTLQFSTNNRNGAKIDVTTTGERSDIYFNSNTAVTATSTADVEIRGGNAALSGVIVAFSSSTGDTQFVASGQATFYSTGSASFTTLDDFEISTTNPASIVEINSSNKISYIAGEQISVETLGGEKGNVVFESQIDTTFALDSLLEIEPDQDLFITTRTNNIAFTAGLNMDILTDGYLDVFAGGIISLNPANSLSVYSDLGKAHVIADVSAAFSAATTLNLQATDGFVWLENGNQTVASRLNWAFSTTSTVSADFGGNIGITGQQGVSFASANQGYFRSVKAMSLTTTAIGGQVILNSAGIVSIVGNNGVFGIAGDSLTATTESRTGGLDFRAQDILYQTSGDTSTEIRFTGAGVTTLLGTNLMDLSAGSQLTVHSTGAVQILSEEGNSDGLTFTTTSGDITLRTNAGGYGNIVMYANQGMVIANTGIVDFQNTNEGIETVASGFVEISNARSQGNVAGVIFDSVDDIRLMTFNDDVTLQGENVIFGVFSLGVAQIVASDGDPANGISVSAPTGGLSVTTGSVQISTQQGGRVNVRGVAVSMSTPTADLNFLAHRHNVLSSRSIGVNAGSDIQFTAPNGRVIFNPQPEGKLTTGGVIRIAPTGAFQIPATAILPNAACSVEQEIAIDEFNQLLCVCERKVWYCI